MAHRTVALLIGVFAVNYMDRQLVALFVEPIKHDLDLSDTQIALLYGLSFAIFYTIVAVPIARLADRGNRAHVITASLVIFSAMTGLCGLAGTYWHLLLARIGVGIGEAGTGPASHSLIADLFPLGKRTTAMACFALGPHLGIVLAFLAGGWLAERFGWRQVFLMAAAVGLALAAITKLMLTEPPRTQVARATGLQDSFRALWQSRSIRHLFAAASIVSIATYAQLGWLPAFLMRSHGMTLSESGAVLALVIGVAGGVGTVLSGLLADRFGARNPSWRLRIVAVAWLAAIPLWLVVLSQPAGALFHTALILAGSLIAVHLGPTFAMVQSLAAPDMRAFAASMLLLFANLIGLCVGPLAVGVMSDAAHERLGVDSLRAALLIIAPLLAWSAWHYHAAARAIGRDLGAATTAPAHAHFR